MSIKSSIITPERNPEEIDYPALVHSPTGDRIYGITIVLMTGPGCGTVVYTEDKRYKVGYHSVDWVSAWKLFTGQVVLVSVGESRWQ